jgi:hypothetical protein
LVTSVTTFHRSYSFAGPISSSVSANPGDIRLITEDWFCISTVWYIDL